MAYNINLHSVQRFSIGPLDEPLINSWKFTPEGPLVINYVIGSATPAAVDVETIIKNYILSTGDVHDDIKIEAELFVVHELGSEPWAVLSGELASSMPGGYSIKTNPLTVTNTITFQNLNLLSEGSYVGYIKLGVKGYKTGVPGNTHIENAKYGLRLNVLNPNHISIAPDALIFSYERGGDLPDGKPLTITTESNWKLTTDKKIVVTGAGLTDESTADQTIVSGSGSKTVQISFSADISTIVGDVFTPSISVTNIEGFSDTTNITLNIFEDVEFIFNPPSLSFLGIKGLEEAAPLDFDVFGFGEFTLTPPFFIELSAVSGEHTGSFKATPYNTSTLDEGVYEGNIVLTAGADTYLLPVVYTVVGTVSTPLDKGNFNFTKEIEFLQVYNVSEGISPEVFNIVSLELLVKYYNYVSFLENEASFSYLLPFLNNTTKYNLGQIIERIMLKALKPSDFGVTSLSSSELKFLPVYKPADVTATVKIINRESKDTLFEKIISEMQFVPGLKPKSLKNNSGILSNTFATKRVTPNSHEVLNFIVKANFYSVEMQKNSEEPVSVSTESTGTNDVFRYKFDFSNYDPGDKITARVIVGADVFRKTYQLLPEGDQSNHIGFISQYNCLELLEMTGGWRIESSIKKINSTTYKDLVEAIENFGSTKQMVLKISTGWIFKEDQVLIDEILRSGKAWLFRDGKDPIELLPREKKFINLDSGLELYNYQIDFDINRKNDAEVYSL